MLLYYITDRTAFSGDESSRRSRLLEKIAEAAHASVDYIQLRERDLSTRELESLAREALRVIHENSQQRLIPEPDSAKPDSAKIIPSPSPHGHTERSRQESEATLAAQSKYPYPPHELRFTSPAHARLDGEHPGQTPALLINSRTDVALAIKADGVHLRSDDASPEDVRKTWACVARENSRQRPLIAVSCHSAAEVADAAANAATFAVFSPIFEKKDASPAGLKLLREACVANIPVFALGGITLANARSCLAAGAGGIAAIRLFQENDIAEVVKRLRG